MSKLGQIVCECDTDTPCCVALDAEPIDARRSTDLADGFKALGDPHRVAIMHLIANAGEPVCVVDVERHLPLAQSTVSYHLKALLDAGIIDREKRTKWNYYSINPQRLATLTAALDEYRTTVLAAA